MKKLYVIAFLSFIANTSFGQFRNEIREENEIGKKFHFENATDSVHYFLDFVFDGFLGHDAIKTTITFWTINESTNKSDTLEFTMLCRWIDDIVIGDSAGYEYNPKTCSQYRNGKEYIFEPRENRVDYPSVRMNIFDPEKRETELDLLLMRKEKK